MSSLTIWPAKQAEFADWLGHLATTVAATPVPFGVSVAQAALLTAANTAFQSAFATAIAPETRTKTAIVNKNVAMKSAKKTAKSTVDIIRANPSITPGQLTLLGIPLPAVRQDVPPPTAMAELSVTPVGPSTLRVKIKAQDSNRRARPVGSTGCVVMSHVGPTPPQDPRDWKLEGTTSKNLFDVSYPLSIDPGTVVWISAYYVNAKLQNGPMTYPPVSVRLAGSIIPAEVGQVKLAA